MCPRRAIRNCCRGGRTAEGQSVPERCRAYRWQYSAGEAYDHALGAKVSVLSQSLKKQEDGLRLGADHSYATSDADIFATLAGIFDLIINTVSADLDLDAYLGPLGAVGVLVNVGAPAKPFADAFSLLTNGRSITGSMIGGSRNPGDARLRRRARCGRRDRNDLGRQDQRRLRAGTGLRRALPRRHRHRHPRSPAG